MEEYSNKLEQILNPNEPEQKDFLQWLNQAIPLRANRFTRNKEILKLTNGFYDLLELGEGYKEEDKKDGLNCILSNLYTADLIGVPVRFSRDSNYYSIPKRYQYPFFSRTIILSIIDKLKEKSFIEIQDGFFDNGKGEGKEARMWAGEILLEILGNLKAKDIEYRPPKDIIILKDKFKKGRKEVNVPVPYEDNEFTNTLRDKLTKINKECEQWDVKIEIPDFTLNELTNKAFLYYVVMSKGIRITKDIKRRLESITDKEIQDIRSTGKVGRDLSITHTICLKYNLLHRVFNWNSWNMGGRFYGSDVQNIPKGLRKFITINGEPSIELDYSGFHVRMLYHEEKLEPPKKDLYSIEGNEKFRDLYKSVGVISIGCNSNQNPIWALKDKFEKDEELLNKFGFGILDYYFIKNLVENFKQEHSLIKDKLFTGQAPRLQNKDSKIMSDILEKITLQCRVPAIPIHDSIIIPETFRKEGETIMMETYKKHMGFYPIVK